MGLFDKLVYGHDLDAEQKRADELDAQLAALNRETLARGRWTEKQMEEAERNRAAGAGGNIEAQVNAAFNEGLADGYSNVTGTIKSTLAAPFKFAFASLPWQLIAAGLVALFFYMGGWHLVSGALLRFKK